jgi:Tfp pilus assembly protein PilV
MDQVVVFFCAVGILGLLGVLGYSLRHSFYRMIRTPYESKWQPSRRTILARNIEDANAELTELDEKETVK